MFVILLLIALVSLGFAVLVLMPAGASTSLSTRLRRLARFPS